MALRRHFNDKLNRISFYHENCFDGLAGAALSDSLVIRPWKHSQKGPTFHPEWFQGRRVEFIDVCPPPAFLEMVCGVAREVVVIDHHKEAVLKARPLLKVYPNLNIVYCPDVAASTLMFLNTFKDSTIPPLLEHINNVDTAKRGCDQSAAITFWLGTLPQTIEAYKEYLTKTEEELDEWGRAGAELMAEKRAIAARLVQGAKELTMQVGGAPVRLLLVEYSDTTVPKNYIMDAADLTRTDFVVMYSKEVELDQEIVFAFRGDKISSPDVDMNKVIVELQARGLEVGGGGHSHAGCVRFAPTEWNTKAFAEDATRLFSTALVGARLI